MNDNTPQNQSANISTAARRFGWRSIERMAAAMMSPLRLAILFILVFGVSGVGASSYSYLRNGSFRKSAIFKFFKSEPAAKVAPAAKGEPAALLFASPTLTASFGANPIVLGAPSTMTFTITNMAGNPAQTGIHFTDTFPSGVVVASPLTVTNTCGGDVQNPGGFVLSAGDVGIHLVNASLSAGTGSCTLTVNVTSATRGVYTNGPANISGLLNLTNGVTNKILTVTGPAFGSCPTNAFFVSSPAYGSPSSLFSVNLATGVRTLLGGLPVDVNAIGFDTQSGYLWGVEVLSGKVILIDSSVGTLSVTIPGLPANPPQTDTFASGVIDTNGRLYIHQFSPSLFTFYVIDVNFNSPTFLTIVDSGSLPVDGLTLGTDWAFNPIDGGLYSIGNDFNTSQNHLYKTNIPLRTVMDLGVIPVLPFAQYGSGYFDSLGQYYISGNISGNTYKLNLSQPGVVPPPLCFRLAQRHRE